MPKEESSSSFGIFFIAPTAKIYFYLRIKLFKFMHIFIRLTVVKLSSDYSQTKNTL